MYNINKTDIEEAIVRCKSAMTIKGQIIGYAFMYGGKNIENRNRKIKNGWYALHVGSSKKPNIKHSIINFLLGDVDEMKLPPCSSIIGCFKIEGYTDKSDGNKWFFGPVGSVVTKFIHFNEPITNIPGHQSITYNLKTIDNKLKKRGYVGTDIRSRIIEQLKNKL